MVLKVCTISSLSSLLRKLNTNTYNGVISASTKLCNATSSTEVYGNSIRQFHTTFRNEKERDRRYYLQGTGRIDEGTDGEKTISLDAIIQKKEDMFVDLNTDNLLFNGVKFSDIPIVHIKISKNNTKFSLNQPRGETILLRTCGMEGFKNTRKGTNVAAQATAITFGMKVLEKGVTDVRVALNGLGPGRMSSVKGLTTAGVNIISVTDNTPIYWNALKPRARKQRRV